MSSAALVLLHVMIALPDWTLEPVVHQSAVLVLSQGVTAGGVGGGLGAQLTWRDRYIAQADVGPLFLLGNVLLTRVAFGMQPDTSWAPAGWITVGALWGQRVEFVDERGWRPAVPTWSLGLRASPLRFRGALGSVSVLEPGVAWSVSGGVWLELALVQAGARF
jgi:hypothetical protein